MNLIIKLFIALLVIGISGLFILKKPDGTPWLSIEDFLPNPEALKNVVSPQSSNDQKIYRWKDDNGQWQYSDQTPEKQIAEEIRVSGNLNRDLVKTVTPKPRVQPTQSQSNTQQSNEESAISLSQENISQLMDDAKNIQNLVDNRNKQLNESQ